MRKNYVKPVSNKYDVRTNQFMAGSSLSFEEDDTNNTFATILDECFYVRVNNTSIVTNDNIVGYFEAKKSNGTYPTLCLLVDIDPNSGDGDCTNGYISQFKSCEVTYDGNQFHITGSTCNASKANLNY